MIRTGIYGGTFNPIHQGHIALSCSLLQSGLLDELWLLVSPQNPFKVNQELLPDEARLQLARLAAKGVEGLSVSDYEFRLPKPSYMVNTLASLRKDYPEREFILVIGADNWEAFHLWHEPDEILCHHRVIVYPRPGCRIGNVPDGVIIADTPLLDISSTSIRQKIGQPGYKGEGLCPEVWDCIVRNNYYGIME